MFKCSIPFYLSLYLITLIKGHHDNANSDEAKIIECVYHDFTKEYNLEIFIDSNDIYTFYEPLDQKLQYTWTSSHVSIRHFTDYIKGYQNKVIDNIQFNATEYQKIIILNKDDNTAVMTFPFFYMNTANTNIEVTGGFGFAFKFIDTKYSLVHQLKSQYMIDHLSYAIIPKKTNKGSLFIGGIPNELLRDVEVIKCKVNPNYITWGCSMTQVIFGNLNTTQAKDIYSLPYYINTHYSYFQAGIKTIKVPSDFFDYLTSVVLYELIKEKQCIYEGELICPVNLIPTIPLFNFVFEGKVAFVFDWNYLFDCTGRYCVFQLEKNDEGDEWVFGVNFIKKHGMVFDYEDQSITFLAKKDYVYLTNDNESKHSYGIHSPYMAMLYCLITVLLTIVSVLLAWIRYAILPKLV